MDVKYGEVVHTNTYSRAVGTEGSVTTFVITQVHVKYTEDGAEDVVNISAGYISCRPGNRVGVVFDTFFPLLMRQRNVALVNLTTRQVGLTPPRILWGQLTLFLILFLGLLLLGKIGGSHPGDDEAITLLLFIAVAPLLALVKQHRIKLFGNALLK